MHTDEPRIIYLRHVAHDTITFAHEQRYSRHFSVLRANSCNDITIVGIHSKARILRGKTSNENVSFCGSYRPPFEALRRTQVVRTIAQVGEAAKRNGEA